MRPFSANCTASRLSYIFPSLIFLIIYNSFDNKPAIEALFQHLTNHKTRFELSTPRCESKWFDICYDNKYSLKCDSSGTGGEEKSRQMAKSVPLNSLSPSLLIINHVKHALSEFSLSHFFPEPENRIQKVSFHVATKGKK